MPGSCHKHATNMLHTCYIHATYMLHTCYIHATNMVPVVTVPIYLFISFQSLKAKSKAGRLEYPEVAEDSGLRADMIFFCEEVGSGKWDGWG
jgi:hypothetical protein